MSNTENLASEMSFETCPLDLGHDVFGCPKQELFQWNDGDLSQPEVG